MQGEQLQEALDHDAAAKAANQQSNQTAPAEQGDADVQRTVEVEVGFDTLVKHLDQKNAYMAKSVSLALLDTARAFTAMATQAEPNKQPEAQRAEKLLNVAKLALELADKASRVGDKATIYGTPGIGIWGGGIQPINNQ